MGNLFNYEDLEKNFLENNKLKIIFEEAKSRLQDSINSYNSLVAKANITLTAILPISAALVGYLISNKIYEKTAFLIPLFSFGISISFSIHHLLKLVFPIEAKANGFLPELLLEKSYVKERLFTFNLITHYNEKIKINCAINRMLGEHLKKGIMWFIFGGVATLTLYIMIAIMHPLSHTDLRENCSSHFQVAHSLCDSHQAGNYHYYPRRRR